MSRWGPYVRQRIDDLKDGKGRDDWEHEWPQRAVTEAAWQVAVDTFRDTTPTPSVVPTADGWVAFIWRKNGREVELEVGPGEVCLWTYDRAAETIWNGDLEDHRDCCMQQLLDGLEGSGDGRFEACGSEVVLKPGEPVPAALLEQDAAGCE